MRLDQAKRLKALEQENTRLKRLVADQALDNMILKEVASGTLLSPSRRANPAVVRAQHRLGVSERRACRVLSQARSTHRASAGRPGRSEPRAGRAPHRVGNAVWASMAGRRPSPGSCAGKVGAVNHKRIERLWRREASARVPSETARSNGAWLVARGWLMHSPPPRVSRDHVWAYDFVADRHGMTAVPVVKILTIVEEYFAGMPGDRGQPAKTDGLLMCSRRSRNSSSPTASRPDIAFRQRPGVHGGAHPTLARGPAGADVVHRAGQPVGERVCWNRSNGIVCGHELLDARDAFTRSAEAQILIER